MKRLTILAIVGTLLAGCGSGEKLDDRFSKAFEDQGKRPQGQANDAQVRGRELPPGATPPPSTP